MRSHSSQINREIFARSFERMGFVFVLHGFESYTESIKPRLGELIKMKHGKLVTSILVLSLAAVTAAFASMAEARSLEQIKASGELLVGSTGD